MRRLRPSLAGLVIFALIGGLSGAVVAQDEDEGLNAWVTGVGQSMTGDPSEVEWSETDSGMSGLGLKVVETVEWSDERLPSEFRSVGNLHANEAGMAVSATELWEGSDGDWTGEWTGACDNEDDCWGVSVLTGQGAHAGLTAVIVTMPPEDPASSAAYKGFIFEGEMPAMPDPVEPAVEQTSEVAAEEAVAIEADPAAEVAAEEEADDTSQTPVFVTGTEICTARAPWSPFSPAVDMLSVRDSVARCENLMSDPRVSGSWLNTMNMDCYGDEFCIYRGTHVLDGPDGGWDCTWTASGFPVEHEGALIIGICPGSGDYEGLTYVFQHTSDVFEDGTSFHGAIYEGDPLVAPSLEMTE